MPARQDEAVTRKLERNIFLTYLSSAIGWARFFLPVFALFYVASQVTLTQFSVIIGAFSATIVVLTIPTGVVADLLGKKKTLIVARVCYVFEIIVLCFANGFWPLLIAKVVSGVGVALSSGAAEGMLYDTLKRLNRVEEHKRISGKSFMIGNISMSIVFLIGAYLFSIAPKLPALASLPFVIIYFLSGFLLFEPYPTVHKLTWQRAKQQFSDSVAYVRTHPQVSSVIGYSAGLYGAFNVGLSYAAVYFVAVSYPVAAIGILTAIGALVTAYAAKRTHSIIHRFGEGKTLRSLQLITIVVLGLAALLTPYFGALWFWLLAFVWGVFMVGSNDYINHHTPTDKRVTILSIDSMAAQLSYTVLIILFGFLIDAYSLGIAFAALAAITLVAVTVQRAAAKPL